MDGPHIFYKSRVASPQKREILGGGKLPENSLDYKSININCFSTIGVRGLHYLTAVSMEVYTLLSMVKCT
jgi:hypothetical protein